MMATFLSDGRRLGFRSRKGTRIISTITKVGKATPAISGGKRESSSCRPRKYQGALEGLGVMPGFALPSKGACNQIETMITKTVMATATMNSLKTNSGKETTISSSLSSRTVDGTSACRRRCSTRSRAAIRSFASVAMAKLQPPAEAVFSDSPEVDDHQQERRQRQPHDVQHVEAQQRIVTDHAPADQQIAGVRSGDGRVLCHVGPHRDGPDGQLVPGQQVAGEAQQQRDQQQQGADAPVELARLLVGAGQKDARHVEPDRDHHRVRRPTVHVADDAAEGDHELQVAHVLVGVLRGGHVIEHQEEPGDGQHDKEEEGQSAEAERVRHPDPGAPYADRVDVEEEVRECGAGRDLVGERKTVAEDRANHLADDGEHLVQRRTDNGHEPSWLADQTFRRNERSTITERSIKSFPSGATSTWTRSIGRGAGPKKLTASRKYRLPWQGHLKPGSAGLALVASWPVSGSLEIE